MNLSKLPKEKRNNLILIALLTAIALCGLGFGLVKWQYSLMAGAAKRKDDALSKLKLMQDTIKRTDQIEAALAQSSKKLSDLEDGMASGDVYSWVLNTVDNFKLAYKVDIPSFSQPLSADMNLLPKFPYKQVTVSVDGHAYYQDLGKFIADFENQFPYIRIVNLAVEPLPALMAGENEKLDFKMDIVSLVKPNRS